MKLTPYTGPVSTEENGAALQPYDGDVVAPGRSWLDVAKDTGAALAGGLNSMVEHGIEAVRPNGNKQTAAWIAKNLGVTDPTAEANAARDSVINSAQGLFSDNAEHWRNQRSDKLQALSAQRESDGSTWGKVKTTLSNPTLLADDVLNSAPEMAVIAATGGAAGEARIASLAARAPAQIEALIAKGATREAAEAAVRKQIQSAATEAGIKTNMALSGVSGGASAATQAREEVTKASDADLLKNKEFVRLLEQTGSVEAARQVMADKAASVAFTYAAPTSALAARLGAGLETTAVMGTLEKRGATALLGNIGKEAGEEYLQEGLSEQLGQNLGAQASGLDANRDLLQGVNEAGVMGAVTGGVLGGGFHAAGAVRQRGEVKIPEQQGGENVSREPAAAGQPAAPAEMVAQGSQSASPDAARGALDTGVLDDDAAGLSEPVAAGDAGSGGPAVAVGGVGPQQQAAVTPASWPDFLRQKGVSPAIRKADPAYEGLRAEYKALKESPVGQVEDAARADAAGEDMGLNAARDQIAQAGEVSALQMAQDLDITPEDAKARIEQITGRPAAEVIGQPAQAALADDGQIAIAPAATDRLSQMEAQLDKIEQAVSGRAQAQIAPSADQGAAPATPIKAKAGFPAARELLGFLNQNGGVSLKRKPDLDQNNRTPGLFRDGGADFDALAMRLIEQGYMAPTGADGDVTVDDARNAEELIGRAIAGEKIYPLADMEERRARDQEQAYRADLSGRADAVGINTRNKSIAQIESALEAHANMSDEDLAAKVKQAAAAYKANKTAQNRKLWQNLTDDLAKRKTLALAAKREEQEAKRLSAVMAEQATVAEAVELMAQELGASAPAVQWAAERAGAISAEQNAIRRKAGYDALANSIFYALNDRKAEAERIDKIIEGSFNGNAGSERNPFGIDAEEAGRTDARAAREGDAAGSGYAGDQGDQGFSLATQDAAELTAKAERENDQALADKQTADAQREGFTLDAQPGGFAPTMQQGADLFGGPSVADLQKSQERARQQAGQSAGADLFAQPVSQPKTDTQPEASAGADSQSNNDQITQPSSGKASGESAVEMKAADQETQAAIAKHALPESTEFKPGKGRLGSGKWYAEADGVTGGLSESIDAAAQSLAQQISAEESRAQAASDMAALSQVVAEKLKRGEQPTDKELKDLFGLNPMNAYVKQSAVGAFLVEYMGVSRNGIRKALGAASGDVTSDGGVKYPIVYPRKLHKVFGTQSGPSRVTPDEAGNFNSGDIVRDEQGKEYMALHARHDWLDAAPIENGKPQVSRDTVVRFHLVPDTASASPERDPRPVFATGRNWHDEQAAQENPPARAETTAKQPETARAEQENSADNDPERFERAMRASANDGQAADDDIVTTSLRYVPFDTALSIAREAVDAGVGLVPAQFHFNLDVTMDSADRLIAAVKALNGSQSKSPAAKIEDVGEKIGGARKDTATKGGTRGRRAGVADETPTWRKRYAVLQDLRDMTIPEDQRPWVIFDKRKEKAVRNGYVRAEFKSEAEAEAALPGIEVARNHRVVATDGGFKIYRDVSDRKRVQVVGQTFGSRDEAMQYMVENAERVIETKTSFGEEILPRPEKVLRSGAPRRDGDVTGRDLKETFGFRGVEFGNWNNQDERQEVMNHAYDALADLAEVLNIPARAIGLNGELALAFGARGHGLSGARAHYELDYGAINLTKMKGAGSLAHEWFHSLDHFFGRQDGKTPATRSPNDRGDMVFGAKDAESAFASHGFKYAGSGVREELREAYSALIKTMFRKAEKFVEDTQRAEKFVGAAKTDLAQELQSLRDYLAKDLDPRYYKRNNKAASAEQLAAFDTIAEAMIAGESLTTEWRYNSQIGKTRAKVSGGRWTNDAMEQLGEIYKAVRGRSGFNAEKTGAMDKLRSYMARYSERLKMLAEAQASTEKTKSVPTDFAMDAKAIDQGRASDYWTTEHEMAARAFQAYVEDKLAEKDSKSYFLTYGTNKLVETPWGWVRPYPAGEERVAINAAFDKFIGAIQTKETEQGVTMAMRTRAMNTGPTRAAPQNRSLKMGEGGRLVKVPRVTSEDARAAIAPLLQSAHNLPPVQMLKSPEQIRKGDEIDQAAYGWMKDRNGLDNMPALMSNGRIYIFTDNLTHLDQAREAILHEGFHYGLRGLMDKNTLDALMLQIREHNPAIADLVENFMQDVPGASVSEATEEVLAEWSQANEMAKLKGFGKIAAVVRKWLRSLGFVRQWSDNDIRLLLQEAQAYWQDKPRNAYAQAVANGTRAQRAYHGSPHRFDKFSLDHIGNGEGAQAYGWGLYFAQKKDIAEWYRGNLSYRDMVRKFRDAMPDDADTSEALEWAESGDAPQEMARVIKALAAEDWLGFDYPAQALTSLFKEPDLYDVSQELAEAAKAMNGSLYEVEIPEDGEMLHWDLPLSEQPVVVRDALAGGSIPNRSGQNILDMDPTGEEIYKASSRMVGDDQAASKWLEEFGIKGIKYRDGASRVDGTGGGTYNYVIFDDAAVQIEARAMRNIRYTPEQQAFRQKAGIGARPTIRQKIERMFRDFRDSISWDAFRQGALDQFHGIRLAEARTVGMLPVEQSAYVTARLATGSSSVMAGLLGHGQAKWAANGQHLEKIDGSKGLLDILKPVEGQLDDWLGWMVANRAARLMKEGRENNFTADDIKAGLALANGREAEFKAVAKEFADFKRSVLDIAEQAGLIDPAGRRLWDHADWIPFYRQMQDDTTKAPGGKRGLSKQSSGIRQLKGGESAMNDPLENILMNFQHLIDASLKNNALRKVIANIEQGPDADAFLESVGYGMQGVMIPRAQVEKQLLAAGVDPLQISAMPPEAFEGLAKMWALHAPEGKDIVRVMDGGKPHFYRVTDPLLLKAVTSFEPFNVPGLGTMRVFKRVLTQSVTATPAFMARNFIRDSASTAMISRDRTAVLGAMRGVLKSFNETGGYEQMLFAGASFAGGQAYGSDQEAAASAMRRALRKKKLSAASTEEFMGTVVDTGAKMLDAWNKIGEAVENANREAVFEAAKLAGKSDTAAAFEALDLMDFRLRGSAALYQLFADITPFLNARVQGLYRLGRSDLKQAAMRSALMLLLPSVLLAMANAGDDEYEALPDWDKDTYWHFFIGGHHFRMPKPFEVGVIFGTLPERITRAALGIDAVRDAAQWIGFRAAASDSPKKLASRAWFNVAEQFNLIQWPQIVKPAIEVWKNEDGFSKRPIENQGDEGKLPSMRASYYTSDTMKALAGMAPGVSDATGLSPKKLEHLFNGYLGSVGATVLAGSDMVVRRFQGLPYREAMRLDEYPLLGVFYRENPAKNSQYVEDIYKMAADATQLKRSMDAARKEGNTERAEKIKAEHGEKIQQEARLRNAAKSMTQAGKQIERVRKSEDLTPDEKREQIDQILERRNLRAADIAKQGIKAWGGSI
ncbi:LPD38 domain-containing protein [Uliginosibacterium sp. 31-12]|uniref:LPD38 domain-containing protein n=1 Tax=Uliginosibacterium sp. 31-12 TaxID=3062781 RepID=UPI0026E21FBE|nr:LPD38 domain-containing protein [Uliginosibacterium sp. 31-12]MDO6385571.1 hypothetical protein [Uliginosibacterium sp. 31-12]